MKIFNSENGLLSRIIMLLGIAVTGGSFIRWTFIWIDISNAIFGITIGALIFFDGWSHGMHKATCGEIASVRKQADAIGAKVTGNSLLAEEETIRGRK